MKKPRSLYLHPQRKKRMRRPEQKLQIAIFNFLRPLMQVQKNHHFTALHIPNGGKRTQYEGMIFKAMGVMPGVSDILLLLPGEVTDDGSRLAWPRVCWVELKAGKQGTTEAQDEFGELMLRYGFDHIVLAADDERDAVNQMVEILKSYGVPC